MIASIPALAIVISALSTTSVTTASQYSLGKGTRVEAVQIQRSDFSRGTQTSPRRPLDLSTRLETPSQTEESESEFDSESPDSSASNGRGTPAAVSIGSVSSIAAATSLGGFDGTAYDANHPQAVPDPSIAIGQNYIVEVTNSTFRVFDQSGNVTANRTLLNFFPLSVGIPFDVRTIYDQFNGRFFVVTLENPQSSPHINLGVSDSENPNSTWHTYRFSGTFLVNGLPTRSDFPSLGVDKDALYVTAPQFSSNHMPVHGCLYQILPMDQLLAGGTVAPTNILTADSFQVRASHSFGDGTAPYFASAESTTSIKLEAIEQPLSASPTLVAFSVTVPSFTFVDPNTLPVTEPAPGVSIRAGNGSIQNVVYRNGVLYVCHPILVNSKVVVRWYEFSMGSWPTSGQPSLRDSGDIDAGNDSMGSPIHTFMPFIAVNGCDEVGVVFTQSSANLYPGVAITGRVPTDPPGTMGAIVGVHSLGFSNSTIWGDYSTIAVEPATNSTFWCVGQYADSVNWRTWISSFFVNSIQHVCPP